jgi:minor extracellular serine protease Vpr
MLGQGLRARLTTIAIALSLTISAIPANANDIDPGLVNTADDETASLWFVELTTAPTSDGTSATAVAASKNAFRSAARATGVSYSERYAYGDLWNGFSVSASAASIGQIQRIAGVKNIWPVASFSLPQPTGGEVLDLASALAMTGADVAQNEFGLSGKGVRVGVIDTGLDYNHPDLGGCFGSSCRVFTGWDFVGNAYNNDSTSLLYDPTPVPDADPDDCNGHGTHVSGIVGANGAVTGVAPGVRFGAYRVFGCDGSTSADIMLAAMERALHDHMDIINMSIGSAFQWPQYPTAVGADRLVGKHGIVVVASIGNSGANGLYAAGAPGLGEKVIGVASFDNARSTQLAFTISPDALAIGYNRASGAPPSPLTGTFPLSRTGTQTTTNDACSAGTPPAPGSLSGTIALIRRGSCTFYEKARNAQLAGAVGVVLYNNAAGALSATVAGTPSVTIPVVGISQADGNLIDTRLAAGPVSLTWTDQTVTTVQPTGNIVSGFSSYGLSPDLALKPDIGAPGGLIFSTYPLELGAYATISGTSMSSPHVAGAVALLLESRPKNLRENGPEEIRAILQNTATPLNRTTNPANGLDNVHRQGAGMLNIAAAVAATAQATPGKLSLGESQAGPQTRRITITSRPGTAASTTYTFSHQAAAGTNPGTFTPTFNTVAAAVAFSTPVVTVKNNQSASVDVTITAPASPERGLYGGYIVATGSDGSTLRVPYAGLIGDYQSIPVMTGLRSAARQTGWVNNAGAIAASYNTGLAGYTFTMTEKPNPGGFGHPTFTDVPYYVIHFDHQSSSATFTAYDSTGTTALGEAFALDFLPRNSTSTGFFAFAWDGFTGPEGAQTMLPNGQYVLKMTLVKALGDAANPAHVETFTFGQVNIQRAP